MSSDWEFQHCELWWETRSELYNVLVFHKLYKLCVTHGHNFSKTTYPAVKNSSRWSTKMSIWICWDVGVKIASDFQTSGLRNCPVEVVQIVFTCKTLERSVKPGRLYVGRWNERVRAKRCDAVDWGLLKQGDSTYLHSNLDFERNYTKLPSMWIRNFFTAFLFCGNGKR